jgi:hypothetical protein
VQVLGSVVQQCFAQGHGQCRGESGEQFAVCDGAEFQWGVRIVEVVADEKRDEVALSVE